MFVMLVQRAERSITSSNEHVPTTYATDRERASSTAHTDTMAVYCKLCIGGDLERGAAKGGSILRDQRAS